MSDEDLDQVLEAGTLLVIETGEYSDRQWAGPVRLTRTATKRELADAFRIEWVKPVNSWHDGPDEGDFLPWLVKTGRAEDVSGVVAWHVGNYGRFEP